MIEINSNVTSLYMQYQDLDLSLDLDFEATLTEDPADHDYPGHTEMNLNLLDSPVELFQKIQGDYPEDNLDLSLEDLHEFVTERVIEYVLEHLWVYT